MANNNTVRYIIYNPFNENYLCGGQAFEDGTTAGSKFKALRELALVITDKALAGKVARRHGCVVHILFV
jgi:hypothetical protein